MKTKLISAALFAALMLSTPAMTATQNPIVAAITGTCTAKIIGDDLPCNPKVAACSVAVPQERLVRSSIFTDEFEERDGLGLQDDGARPGLTVGFESFRDRVEVANRTGWGNQRSNLKISKKLRAG